MSDFQSGLPIRLHDENNEVYDENNPLPVTIEESEGDEIHDYDTEADVLKDSGAVSNHDYVVNVGKTFLLSKVLFAASGRMKVELQVETAVASAIFTTKAVFITSTAKPSDELALEKTLKVISGVTVRVIRTNLDNQDQDLYSTIIGVEK